MHSGRSTCTFGVMCIKISFNCSTKFYYDARLRNAAVQVYASLYGRLTPKCVPQGVSFARYLVTYTCEERQKEGPEDECVNKRT